MRGRRRACAAVLILAGGVLQAQESAPGAQRLVTRQLWSQALGTHKQYVAYLPPSYHRDSTSRFPVVYYLHGLYGDEWNWVRLGRLDAVMDSLVAAGGAELVVIMPDGDDGWYTTWNSLGNHAACRRESPPGREREDPGAYCVPWPHYDDYIARDLVAHVDSIFRSLPRRAHRGIAGLSMGGYGAVSLALAYPEVFAAAASHSGVLSPMYVGPHPYAPPPRYATTLDEVREAWSTSWESRLLAFGRDTSAWWARDPARLARRLRRDGEPVPALFLDVGLQDRFLDGNRAFRAELAALGFAAEYHEHPGGHDWTYWRAHVRESLAWMGARLAPRR